MEWELFLGAAALLLTVGGWLYNKHKDREQEKFKQRIIRREELVKTFLKYHQILQETRGDLRARDNEATQVWLTLVGLMRLYGTQQENEKLNNFAENFLGENKSIKGANESLNSLRNTLVSTVRYELGFE